MKKTASCFIAAAALMCATQALASSPTVYFNGTEMTFDAEPYISEDRTMVPFRALFEAVDADVVWDAETQTVIAVRPDEAGSTSITLQIGSTDAFVNEEKVTLDKAAEITGDRTFVPLRFVMESLGADVEWDPDTASVYITTEG